MENLIKNLMIYTVHLVFWSSKRRYIGLDMSLGGNDECIENFGGGDSWKVSSLKTGEKEE
jgi:hypothetical protein